MISVMLKKMLVLTVLVVVGYMYVNAHPSLHAKLNNWANNPPSAMKQIGSYEKSAVQGASNWVGSHGGTIQGAAQSAANWVGSHSGTATSTSQ